jgi:cell wall-associated NlpC family hydrolase
VSTLGHEIKPYQATAGDFVLLKVKDTGEVSGVAVCVGNGYFITAFAGSGSKIASMGKYNIVKAWRWRSV